MYKIVHIYRSGYAGKNDITFLQDGYTQENTPVIFSGIEAMIRYVGGHHPTGSVFRRDIFEAIPDRQYYFTHSDMYPENFLRRDMLLHGKGASIRSGVFIYPASLVDRTKSNPQSSMIWISMTCFMPPEEGLYCFSSHWT